MANKKRHWEFEIFPKYKQLYIMTFDKMLEARKVKNFEIRESWKTGNDVFDWWLQNDRK